MATLTDLTKNLLLGSLGDVDSTNQVIAALQDSGTSSVNGITGAVSIIAGSNITVTPSGQNITIAATGGGGGGANTTLSNLTSPTSVNQNLLPGTNNTFNLGAESASWSRGTINLLMDTNATTAIDVNDRRLIDSTNTEQLTWSTTGVTILNELDIIPLTLRPSESAALSEWGPASFVGNVSDEDQSNLAFVVGSLDTSTNSNSTSNTILMTGDNTASGSTGSTGTISIAAGNIVSGSSANGGNVYVTAGTIEDGTGTGGSIGVTAGSSASGVAGIVQIFAGSSLDNSQPGGGITLATGTGSIEGIIQLVDGSQTGPSQVWTSTDAAGSGHWSPAGTGTITSGSSSLLVTNSLVTTSSLVFVTILTNNATAVLKSVVPGSGNFTIEMSTTTNVNTNFAYFVL